MKRYTVDYVGYGDIPVWLVFKDGKEVVFESSDPEPALQECSILNYADDLEFYKEFG